MEAVPVFIPKPGISIFSRKIQMRIFALIVTALTLFLIKAFGDPSPNLAPEKTLIVLSIRQFQEVGKSNIHLYEYALDGTLVKTLTNEAGFDDLNPQFNYDGTEIVFEREPTDAAHEGKGGLYSMDFLTGKISRLKKLYSTPGGDFVDIFSPSFSDLKGEWLVNVEQTYQSPDGKYMLIYKPYIGDDGSPPGKMWLLKEPGKEPLYIETLPGFISDQDISGFEALQVSNGNPFVSAEDLQAIFFSQHLGSMYGDRLWGFDLLRKKWSKLAENGGVVYHMPSCAGVFVAAETRYVPLGKTGKTVNCVNLEWCDCRLNIIRFGPELSVFYSAAIHHQASGSTGSESFQFSN